MYLDFLGIGAQKAGTTWLLGESRFNTATNGQTIRM